MDSTAIGKILVIAGLVVVALGAVLYFGGGRFFSFLGRLPGDIRYEGESTRFFFPITTSILISIVLSVLLYLISRFR